MTNCFIVGTGTSVGKTYILTSIIRELKKRNKDVMALKPLLSGCDDFNNDVNQILTALSLPINQQNIDLVSFKCLKAPVSPNMAANIEGIELNYAEILQFCINHLDRYEYLFIEGAGGVMSPLTNHHTYKDLVVALKVPVIFIAQTYLGTISHILTGLEALRGCEVKAVVLNPYGHNGYVDIGDLQKCIQSFAEVPVIEYNLQRVIDLISKT